LDSSSIELVFPGYLDVTRLAANFSGIEHEFLLDLLLQVLPLTRAEETVALGVDDEEIRNSHGEKNTQDPSNPGYSLGPGKSAANVCFRSFVHQ
jgi:hypothetical protein